MRSREIVALLAVASLAFAAPAHALILPAVTLDGPSEEIVGFGGVAMAEDGTGGLVYLKRVQGVAHVFVSRYREGHWSAPIRVDGENQFAASWPRIGAANHGELLVVWATPFATENEKPVQQLLSSMLGPGSDAFSPAVVVDPDIREGTGTSPALAMSSTGQADVVYRVVQPQSSVPLLRPGDVQEGVRVARYGGERWTRLGAINRDPGLSMRAPTAANAPQIAVSPTGNAIVVWQEPELNGVARIWARRLFGSSVDYAMAASAETFGAAPIPEDADAPAVALSPLGQAEVAYRQTAGRSSPLPGPRIFLNILSDGEATSGAQFEGASIADNAVGGGKGATVGRPSIDVDERQAVRILYDNNGVPRVVTGTDLGLSGTLNLGSPFAGSALTPASELPSASVVNPEGGGVSAWPSADRRGVPGVGVREDYPEGGVQTGLLGGGTGGSIGELAVGRSGLGDGLVAFQQGPLGSAAIVAATVTATPAHFIVSAPKGWIKPTRALVDWEPAASANGPLSYALVLDGRQLPTRPGTRSMSLDPRALRSGTHQLQLLATDRYGQQTLTAPTHLKVDGRPPAIGVTLTAGRRLRLALRDAQSGLAAGGVSVSFGDGAHGGRRATLTHRYARPGTYLLVVRARDKLGNAVVLRRKVRVR